MNQFYIAIGRDVGADFKLTGMQSIGNLLIRLTGTGVWTDQCDCNLVIEAIALSQPMAGGPNFRVAHGSKPPALVIGKESLGLTMAHDKN